MQRPFIAALSLAAAFAAGAAAAKDRPDPFQVKGSTGIDCLGTPFGKRISLGRDQEPILIRRQTNGTAANFQLAGLSLAQERQGALDGVLASATRMASANTDLDGDGRDELVVVAGRSNGAIGVRTVRRSATTAGANDQFGGWEWTSNQGSALLDLQVASADLDGSTDGRREIVVAARWANNVVRVIALSGDANGNIAQASNAALGTWILPAAEFNGTANVRLAAADVLLEGRDQVVLVSTRSQPVSTYAWIVVRAAGSATGTNPAMTLTHRTFLDTGVSPPNEVADLQLHAGDLGGSAAAELLIHATPQDPKGTLGPVSQALRFFTTTRGSANQITDFALQAPTNANTVPNSGERFVAVAMGEVDRRPDLEFVVARQLQNTPTMRIEVFKALFNAQGFPIGVAPATPAIVADVVLPVGDGRLERAQFDLAVGDADGDSIGDVFLAVRDRVTASGSAVLTRVRRFAMQRPADPNAFPNPASFQLRNTFDFPTSFGDTNELQLRLADWDRDSVLADLGTTCRRVREPLVRSVVKLPPYWERLQANSSGFLATIGKTRTTGSTQEQRFDTFSSHDVSAYLGVSVGGDILGIGAKAAAKATAGYNYESRRGELRGSEATTTTGESQQQDRGEGLVVVEENTFDCYDYQVLRDGVADGGSDVRACELIRRGANNDQLRSFTATDLQTWDTFTGAGSGVGGPPSQWMPLQPDWASIALFRNATVNFAPASGTQTGNVTDGQFGAGLMSPVDATAPFVQIDLGETRDITSIRVFPLTGQAATLDGFRLHASETAFAGDAPPSGPGVTTIEPDPLSRNGVDRWNIRTRGNLASGFAPLRARYVRLQHPGTATVRVAEIQVFGDVHKDPPDYPQSVTDPVRNDGRFRARVANRLGSPARYVCIDVRGDLLWTGAPVDTSTDPFDAKFNCAAIQLAPPPAPGQLPGAPFLTSIWSSVTIGGTGINAWDLADSTTNTVGSNNSISHSTRVGAELDFEAGVIVQAVGGGAYEYSTGVTEENSTTMYWGQGLMYAGAVGGFPAGSNLNCEYRTQPYAYRASERSNVGYEHQFTVVDYVVRDLTWSRLGPVLPPQDCFPVRSDLIFRGDFEPPSP
ncbi:MAG: hypothetical protein ACK59M_13900 [Pseudomonadota bacterium]|jgi:hypothetical protein